MTNQFVGVNIWSKLEKAFQEGVTVAMQPT